MGGWLTQGLSHSGDQQFTMNGGYRPPLFELAVADEKNITFVGLMDDGPDTVAGRPFPGQHHGHPGWFVNNYLDIILTPALTYSPNIILLEVGMPDMTNSDGRALEAPVYLANLVNKILANAPETLLVLATVPNIQWPAGDAAVAQFNTAVRQIADSQPNILLVDFHAMTIPSAPTPTDAGYRIVAQAWYDAIAPYLP